MASRGEREALAAEFKPLVDSESQHAKHEMSHDLVGPPATDVTGSKLIFQTGVDAFQGSALSETDVFGGLSKSGSGNASAPLTGYGY